MAWWKWSKGPGPTTVSWLRTLREPVGNQRVGMLGRGERYVVQGAFFQNHVPMLWDNFSCSHVILRDVRCWCVSKLKKYIFTFSFKYQVYNIPFISPVTISTTCDVWPAGPAGHPKWSFYVNSEIFDHPKTAWIFFPAGFMKVWNRRFVPFSNGGDLFRWSGH